jgi:hypothetical protein
MHFTGRLVVLVFLGCAAPWLFGFGAPTSCGAEAARPPNVVIIFADDNDSAQLRKGKLPRNILRLSRVSFIYTAPQINGNWPRFRWINYT